jgi:hypothetical protein
VSRLTGLTEVMVQAICHGTRADDLQRARLAVARIANSVVEEGS